MGRRVPVLAVAVCVVFITAIIIRYQQLLSSRHLINMSSHLPPSKMDVVFQSTTERRMAEVEDPKSDGEQASSGSAMTSIQNVSVSHGETAGSERTVIDEMSVGNDDVPVAVLDTSEEKTTTNGSSFTHVIDGTLVDSNVNSLQKHVGSGLEEVAMEPVSSVIRDDSTYQMRLSSSAVTLVTQLSTDRLIYLKALVSRWRHKISAAIHVPYHASLLTARTKIEQMNFDDRVVISIYQDEGKSAPYPINMLRNLARSKVSTSHFITIDADLMPSVDLDQAVAGLVGLYLEQTHYAIVVPAWEFSPRKLKYNCENPKVTPTMCLDYYDDFIPKNFGDLETCYQMRSCQQFYYHGAPETHRSTDYKKWIKSEEPYRLRCIDSVRYEPYLILPNAPSTPLYDERFEGYGKNKIELINHVRYSGFEFFVLPTGFLFHIPHPQSQSKRNWTLSGTKIREKNDALFHEFKQWLQSFDSPKKIGICHAGETSTSQPSEEMRDEAADKLMTKFAGKI